MAFVTSLNDQVTDSVTQTSVELLGLVPAVATGNLMMATSFALAGAAQNATYAQQQANTLADASTTKGVNLLLSLKLPPLPKPKR